MHPPPEAPAILAHPGLRAKWFTSCPALPLALEPLSCPEGAESLEQETLPGATEGVKRVLR